MEKSPINLSPYAHAVSAGVAPSSIQSSAPFTCSGYSQVSLEALEDLMLLNFQWSKVRSFQLEGTRAQLDGRDAMIHVGTGCGKTAVAAGPYVLDENRKKTTLIVSPLLALHDEQVCTLPCVYFD
jgi:ATP-dependent helicase YprA (DUF1998 family)